MIFVPLLIVSPALLPFIVFGILYMFIPLKYAIFFAVMFFGFELILLEFVKFESEQYF